MAQNTPNPQGSPYWAEPPMTEEKIQEQEYVLDDGYWKQPEAQAAPKCPARPAPMPSDMSHSTEMPAGQRPAWLMHDALAMAYVPRQKWTELYQPDVGFSRGTIFPALDKPFIGEGGMHR